MDDNTDTQFALPLARWLRFVSRDFGIWAMLIFWGSAIGGIVLGISWAKSKRRNPVDRQTLLQLLERQRERGEIDDDEYRARLSRIEPGADSEGR